MTLHSICEEHRKSNSKEVRVEVQHSGLIFHGSWSRLGSGDRWNQVESLWVAYFSRIPQYSQITTMTMYLLIEIKHTVLLQCHGNYTEVDLIQLYALN